MTDNNPYQAPAANLQQGEGGARFELTEPRAVAADRGWGWIADGFGYFKRNPGAWILMLLVLLGLVIVLSFVPLVGQLAVSVTYFVWTGGIMLGCRAQAENKDFEVGHLFAGFQKHAGKLILLSIIVSVASLMIMTVAVGPAYFDILSASGGELTPELVEAMGDPTSFLLRLLVGMLVMIPLMMAVWFAPVLIVSNDVPVLESLRLSFVGCLRNVLPFLLYGIILFALYIVAIIPLGLGLLVLMPTVFASMFIAYRDIFVK